MEPFDQALTVIAGVMRDGVATHHDNDWIHWPADYHLARAEQYLPCCAKATSNRTI
jgi:hypothetical protein